MQTTLRELDISCLPGDIPDQIDVDVTNLGIGESVHVKDLDLGNVSILTELGRTIVVISAPTIIKSAAAEGAEAAEGETAEAAEGAETAEGAEGEKKAEGGDTKKKEEKK